MKRDSLVYLDSSAIVKLVVAEAGSEALRETLRRFRHRGSSALARVEVPRAVRHQGDRAVRRARQVLDRIRLLRLDDSLLDTAAGLDLPALRSLDAIHIAAAMGFGGSLEALVTYDTRMMLAGQELGLPVMAPV